MSVWHDVVAGDVMMITTPGGKPENVQVSVRAVTVRGTGSPPATVLIDEANNAWVEHGDRQLAFVKRAGAAGVLALGLDPQWLLSRRYRG